MIYLIHGEDTVSSRNFLLKLRENYDSVELISLKNIKDPKTILPSGVGLFSTKKLLILEHFSIAKSQELDKDLEYDVVLWFGESITVPKWVDKFWYFKPTGSVSTFKLADCIALGQEKQALETLETLLRNIKDREMIVGTLVRQLKMIALSLSGENSIVSTSAFIQQKVSDQARNWNVRKLKTAALFLLKTDLWIKQGRLSHEILLTKLTLDLCRLAQN